MFPEEFNPEVFENNVENMKHFINTYKPALEDGNPIMRDPEEVEAIAKMDPRLVWTEMQLDQTCITNGFLNAEKDERINGYYICAIPCSDEPLTNSIYSEIRITCTNCDIDDEDSENVCRICDGMGFTYRYLNEIWPSM